MSGERAGSYPHRCRMCDSDRDITRMERSDSCVEWACPEHLVMVFVDFQRRPDESIWVYECGRGREGGGWVATMDVAS